MHCFYHVPVKVVYEVLGMSHHTLAPLRRKWNLRRWPFADICRGAFKIDGVYVTWDDIENKRKEMVALPDIDIRIVKILEVMGERARFHKHKVNWVITNERKEEQKEISRALEQARHEKMLENGILQEDHHDVSPPANSDPPEAAETIVPTDEEWLETFSQLLAAELDAPIGELFPPLFE